MTHTPVPLNPGDPVRTYPVHQGMVTVMVATTGSWDLLPESERRTRLDAAREHAEHGAIPRLLDLTGCRRIPGDTSRVEPVTVTGHQTLPDGVAARITFLAYDPNSPLDSSSTYALEGPTERESSR